MLFRMFDITNKEMLGRLIVFITALVCFWISTYMIRSERKLLKKCVITKGTVKEIGKKFIDSRTKRYQYYPVIEFDTNNGPVNFHANEGFGGSSYEVGEQVEILYNPKNPKEAQINKFTYKWGLITLLITVGAVNVLLLIVSLLP